MFFETENADLLANIAGILRSLLPQINITGDNVGIWERLVLLLSHTSLTVKRSALHTIKNIITSNATQTQYMIECGLISKLSEVLINSNEDTRIDVCTVLALLGKQGYSWVIK